MGVGFCVLFFGGGGGGVGCACCVWGGGGGGELAVPGPGIEPVPQQQLEPQQ